MFELFDTKEDVRIKCGANLPHWYQPGVSYFVTFRTEDSIPADVCRRWHARRAAWLFEHGISMNELNWKDHLDQLAETDRRGFHESFSREYMESLDKGHGECVLRRPELSKFVADSLLHFDNDRYHMGDFVVMPNHVHLIVCLLGDSEIEAICTSWKRYSAGKINQVLGKKGRFWQEESFDHLIRSVDQFEVIQKYIASNPRNLNLSEYQMYEQKVADTFQVPSAESPKTVDLQATAELSGVIGNGTRSVPATLMNDE